jgi:hypothetical protein
MPKPPLEHSHCLYTSPDGVHWSPGTPAGMAQDAQSLFFNPFRKVWVYSIKRNITRNGKSLRARWYVESSDFLKGFNWEDAVYWTCADRLDLPEPADGYPAYPQPGGPCQLYTLQGSPYESILLGMHEIHRGPKNPVCVKGEFPKLTDLELGFSRDGFHWHRPDRGGFICGTRREGHLDRAYLHSTTSICLAHDDHLYFPYSGFSGINPDSSEPGVYQGGAIGIATLRRDGFASVHAGRKSETLLTRPVSFSDRYLFVNVDAPGGSLRVELCDEQGEPLPGFAASDCTPIEGDSTKTRVRWQSNASMDAYVHQPVRFKFHLRNGDLYSFWTSGSLHGTSGGYLAGGGSAFKSRQDTS